MELPLHLLLLLLVHFSQHQAVLDAWGNSQLACSVPLVFPVFELASDTLR